MITNNVMDCNSNNNENRFHFMKLPLTITAKSHFSYFTDAFSETHGLFFCMYKGLWHVTSSVGLLYNALTEIFT